jgi:hypothetical protein
VVFLYRRKAKPIIPNEKIISVEGSGTEFVRVLISSIGEKLLIESTIPLFLIPVKYI